MIKKHLDFLRYWLFNRVPRCPTELRIEITNRCNLNCVFCDRGAMKRPVQDMDLPLFTKICTEAVEFGIPVLGLNRFGEPTLHPELPRMIAIAKDAGAKRVEFATNATRLTEALSSEIIDAGLDRIEFSIDSMNPALYNTLRVGANFSKTHENILTFLRLCKEKKAKTKTLVSFICMNQNAQEVAEYSRYWKSKVDSIIFYPYTGYGNLADFHALRMFSPKRVKCFLFYYMMSAYSDGMAGICCTGDPNATLATLDLRTHTVEEAWNCIQANAIRKVHFDGDFEKLPICLNCDMTLPYWNWAMHQLWLWKKKHS